MRPPLRVAVRLSVRPPVCSVRTSNSRTSRSYKV